jgi:hypothetical protein
MFSKNTKSKDLDRDQRELFEHAQDRIKQKKRLTQHFVVFLAGSVLLIVINVVLGYGKDVKLFGADWFVWAILLWTFFFLVHALNVVITNKFMGKDWEQKQMDKLVEKQKRKIEEMRQKVAVDMPLPEKKSTLQNQKPTDPNLPLNS